MAQHPLATPDGMFCCTKTVAIAVSWPGDNSRMRRRGRGGGCVGFRSLWSFCLGALCTYCVHVISVAKFNPGIQLLILSSVDIIPGIYEVCGRVLDYV